MIPVVPLAVAIRTAGPERLAPLYPDFQIVVILFQQAAHVLAMAIVEMGNIVLISLLVLANGVTDFIKLRDQKYGERFGLFY